ncbi:hypothetical protein ACIRVF_07970 [Kitasatospora sp. NPDC101157]|uniref:hypothetical protein n=1 Tax=Kitasatospora sp. NPDC101157 TaxID=3364098 RepID=UPI003817CF08
MPTILLDAQPPANMPVWARLQLIARDLPFTDVAEWHYERAGLISIITIDGGWTVVTRPAA